MGKYSVPEEIRKFKPTGTMVKIVNGKNYYVYEYFNRKNEDGKWRTKMGKMVGIIKEGVGFIPNDSYNKIQTSTILEYGQYAVVVANSKKTLQKLLDIFNPMDAYQIYFMALIHFVNGFTYLKNIESHFKLSYLSAIYPDVKLSYHVLSSLLDSLGRKQERVHQFEQSLLDNSSKELAFDGHVIPSSSHENDLSEKGNKFQKINNAQLNVLMAYDVNTHEPLLSRIYEGGNLDKTSIKDVMERFEFKDTLFIIDRGFHSESNIEAFSSNNNQYIIPLSINLKSYKQAVTDMNLDKVFVYERNKKRSTIEYQEIIKDDNKTKIIIYRDVNQNAIEKADYLKNLEQEKKNYTEENYNKVKDFFGVIVLQTNCMDKTAKEIFESYKKRWSIETFYNYFKNGVEFNGLHVEDYYMTQGLSFIMLIVGLIHREFKESMKEIKGKTIDDILLESRFIKVHKNRGKWRVENIKQSRLDIMKLLNVDFEDLEKMK